jgi:hypothetical protein
MMNGQAEALMQRASAAGQGHVLRYFDQLTEDSQRQLLHQVALIDFNMMARLHREYIAKKKAPENPSLEPAEIITLAQQRSHPQETAKMIAIGEQNSAPVKSPRCWSPAAKLPAWV